MFEYSIDGKKYRDDPQRIYDEMLLKCRDVSPQELADRANSDQSQLAANGRLGIREVICHVFGLADAREGGPGWDQILRLWNHYWTWSDDAKKKAGLSPTSSPVITSTSTPPAPSAESIQPMPSSG